MQTRTNVFLWSLYDFANSIVYIVFFLYYAQWVVIDAGVNDLWYNLTFTLTALLLLGTVPLTGLLLDARWRRLTGLRWTTAGTVLGNGGTAVLALLGHPFGSLLVFTAGLYCYLLSFTFYTPLLNDIALPERRGRVSGYGIMANYLGQFTGLLIALPFATGALKWFGSSPRVETLLPAVFIFLMLSLPTLIWFREPRRTGMPAPLRETIRASWRATKLLFLAPGIAAFFLSYFLFNDAVLTAANNFSIFLEQVWGVPDTVKTFILLGIILTSALGGALGGLLADRWGEKRVLTWILTGWIIILPTLGLLHHFPTFIAVTVVMGLWFGGNWAVTRSFMGTLAPAGQSNLTFAYFGLVERASSLIGPVIWGLIVTELVSLGPNRYRLATVVVSVFILFGLLALRRVPSDRPER